MRDRSRQRATLCAAQEAPQCVACPEPSGAFKRVANSDTKWAHVACALILPNMGFRQPRVLGGPFIHGRAFPFGPPCKLCPDQGRGEKAADGGKVRRTPSSSGFRVVARLGPGDHFGETALLEGRNQRNTTVRCTSPVCELREMPNEEFKKFLRESSQLSASVHAAAVSRNNRRVRKVIRAAEEEGKATMLKLKPGQVIFHQGDRSDAFS